MGLTGLEFQSSPATIADTALYAGKSMARTTLGGQVVDYVDLGAAGPTLEGVPDRWVVAGSVDEPRQRNASMISQRGWGAAGSRAVDFPGDSELALVQTDVVNRRELAIAIPGHQSFTVAVGDTYGRDPWTVRIHQGEYVAADLGNIAAALFTQYLNRAYPDSPWRDVRLFGGKLDGENQRQVRGEYRHDGVSGRLHGADSAAVLLVNKASLDAMRDQHDIAEEELGIDRTRANLVIQDLEPFAERHIRAIRVGGVVLMNVGPSSRCVETGVDPATGARDDNRFLKVLGQSGQAGWSATTGDRGLFFGANFQPVLMPGRTERIRVGDPVEIAWRNEPDVLSQKPA
jgi:uncharacterized protein YcbX